MHLHKSTSLFYVHSLIGYSLFGHSFSGTRQGKKQSMHESAVKISAHPVQPRKDCGRYPNNNVLSFIGKRCANLTYPGLRSPSLVRSSHYAPPSIPPQGLAVVRDRCAAYASMNLTVKSFCGANLLVVLANSLARTTKGISYTV